MATTWKNAVIDAIRRLTNDKNSKIFTRQELVEQQLPRITDLVGSAGETPAQTLSRILQELRDEKLLEFTENRGIYYSLLDDINIEQEELPDEVIDSAINTRKLRFEDIFTDETLAQKRQRIGQQRLRYLTLRNYNSQCALCDISEERFLIAAHIARWADYPEGRGDLANIICLCRWHDPMLEYGLISLSNEYEVLKKMNRTKILKNLLQETKTFRKPLDIPPSPEYLTIHRKRTGFE